LRRKTAVRDVSPRPATVSPSWTREVKLLRRMSAPLTKAGAYGDSGADGALVGGGTVSVCDSDSTREPVRVGGREALGRRDAVGEPCVRVSPGPEREADTVRAVVAVARSVVVAVAVFPVAEVVSRWEEVRVAEPVFTDEDTDDECVPLAVRGPEDDVVIDLVALVVTGGVGVLRMVELGVGEYEPVFRTEQFHTVQVPPPPTAALVALLPPPAHQTDASDHRRAAAEAVAELTTAVPPGAGRHYIDNDYGD